MYARNISDLVLSGIAKSDDSLSEFNETDENGRRYRALGLRKRGGAWKKEDRPNMFYPIYVNPDNGECFLDKKQNHFIEVIPKRPTGELSRWTWGKEKFSAERHLLVGKMVNRGSENANDNWDVFRKDYIDTESGEEKTTKLKTMWIEKEINYQNAKNEIKALFGNSEVFDYPKPTYIVQQLATIMNLEDEDIVMDFFSGSASSAQAIMQFNHNQSTKVRFIMVQISESIPEKSEAYKMGYRLITEIGEERIRRAGKKIKEESGLLSSTIDIGFRVLKLDSSNMQEVYYNPSAMTQDILAMTVDNVKADRTPLDLLFQVMLDLGIELSAKIEENSVNGKTYYAVNGNDIIACFDDDIDNDVITAIAKQNPLYAVFKDKSFATDSVGINNEQLFKTYSPSTVVKVI